jgi:O-antigen/teichoic acid export membrane protein
MASSCAVTIPQSEEAPRARAHAENFGLQITHISSQSSIFFVGTIFTAAVGYLFRIYLARVLGAEALGVYALGMTIVGFLGICNSLGLPQSAVRFVASYSATGKFEQLGGFLGRGTVLLLTSNLVLAGVILTAGPWFAVQFYHAPSLVPYLWLFALIMLLGELNIFLGQALAGYKDVARRTVITNFVGSPLTMGFTVGLLWLGRGLWGYIFAQMASAAMVLLLLTRAVWRLTPSAARRALYAPPRLQPEVISFSLTSLGVGFLEFLMGQTDKVFIGFYLSARDLGIYAVAMTLVAFVPIALQSVNQIFAPTIADLHARGERELLGRIFQTLTKWILGLTLPLAVVVIIFARPLMGIFGHEFESGWPILVIGTLGQLVNCGAGSVGYLLLMSGNQHRLVKVQAAMAAVMLLLSLALIPRWGIAGAAVAAAVTNAASNVWYLREVDKSLGLHPNRRGYLQLIAPLTAALAVCLVLRTRIGLAHASGTVIGSSLVLAYLTFTGVALLFGLSSDDRLVANTIWSKIQGWRETKQDIAAAAACVISEGSSVHEE